MALPGPLHQPTGVLRTPRPTLRYLVFGRVLPGVIYTILGLIILRQTVASYQNLSGAGLFGIAAGPVRWTLYLLFVSLPVGVYLTRPMPQARDSSLVAWSAALIGTTLLLFTGAFAPVGQLILAVPNWIVDLSDLMLAAATALGVWGLLLLRNSFSIVPEARRVVRGGPYRFIRHPLYSSEILVSVALLIAAGPSPYGLHLVATCSVLVFIAVQMWRIRLEEQLLTRVFPEYAEYATTTSRLFPFIW